MTEPPGWNHLIHYPLPQTASLTLRLQKNQNIALANRSLNENYFNFLIIINANLCLNLTLTFRTMDRDWSSKNSTRTCVTVPREPVRPITVFTLASLGRPESLSCKYGSSEANFLTPHTKHKYLKFVHFIQTTCYFKAALLNANYDALQCLPFSHELDFFISRAILNLRSELPE